MFALLLAASESNSVSIALGVAVGVATTAVVALLTFAWNRTGWASGSRTVNMRLDNANELLRSGQYGEARGQVQKCIEFLEGQQRYSSLCKAYLLLGDADRGLKEWPAAIGHYVLAEANARKSNAENLDAVLAKLGKAHADAGHNDDAVTYLTRAIEIGSGERDRAIIILAECYKSRGKVQAARGNVDRAVSDYFEALNYEKEIPDFARQRAATYAELGDVFLKDERYEEARTQLNCAAELYAQVGDAALVEMLGEKIKDIPQMAASGAKATAAALKQ